MHKKHISPQNTCHECKKRTERCGYGEKVLKFGWKSLSAKETGKIGGLVSKRKKALQNAQQEQM